jgi:TPR repeat protein
MGQSIEFLEQRMAEARSGRPDALYDLGVAFAAGRYGAGVDLIAAHKWFNLAARAGDERAAVDRSEVAAEMDAWQIAEAQRQARAWLGAA